MKNKIESSVVVVENGQRLVAMMIRGTADSSFTLMRGVPSNSDGRMDEYLWADVYENGLPVELLQNHTNPIVVTTPGTYKFRNNGTDDEQALIDMTVYK